MVNIKGLDKAEVLLALCNGTEISDPMSSEDNFARC